MNNCPLYARCLEIFNQVNIPANILESKRNTCFARCCYKEGKIYSRGNHIYQIPIGSCRFGIKIKPELDETEISHNWVNSYHGTKPKNVRSIIEFGLNVPTTRLPSGKIIKIIDGHIPEENCIFSSPSFLCSCGNYATIYNDEKSGKQYKFILQLRLKPNSFLSQDDTYINKLEDKYVRSVLFEYVTNEINQKNIAIIGVCIFEINALLNNPHLPQELLEGNLDDFAIPWEDELKKREAVKKILKECPDIKNQIAYVKNNITVIFGIEKLHQRVQTLKMGKGLAKISSNGLGIVGGILGFTKNCLGSKVSLFASGLGIFTEIITYYKEKSITEEISKMDQIMKKAKDLNKIMQQFYNQRNMDFADLKGKVNAEGPVKIEDICKVAQGTGGVLCDSYKLMNDAKKTEITEILKNLYGQFTFSNENITRLTEEIAKKDQELVHLLQKVKSLKEANAKPLGFFQSVLAFFSFGSSTKDTLIPNEISKNAKNIKEIYKTNFQNHMTAYVESQTTQELNFEIATKATEKSAVTEEGSRYGEDSKTIGVFGIVCDVYGIYRNVYSLVEKGDLEKAAETLQKNNIYLERRVGGAVSVGINSFQSQMRDFEEILERFKD